MAVAFELVYSVFDEKGKSSTFAVHVPTSFSLSQYGEFAVALGTIVDKLLAGKLADAQLCFGADLSALTGNTIEASSDVEERARFTYLTGDGRPVVMSVPTLNESLVSVGADELDLLDANVAAVDSMMLDGLAVTGGTIIPCDVNEDDLVTLLSAVESFVP